MRVHGVDLSTGQPPALDIRLVRRDDEPEALLAQSVQSRRRIRHDDHLFDRVGRQRLAVFHEGLVQHAVPVEEDCPRHAFAGAFSTPSHLVCLAFSAGWLTSRCQMTAWNASEWGVTASGFTVGTMQTASPTSAVYPPSRPTTPNTLAPIVLAYCSARTRLGLTFFSRLPPPTEKTNSASSALSRLTLSHSTNTVSQPSSLVRAVSSDTLSVGA